MSKPAEGFKSRWGFLLAAMGSAIGLGNIWRYPVTAYQNGGGSFLIPYLVALFTAGIPLLILEFNLGNKLRGSAPEVFKKLHPKLEFVGWWQTFTCSVVPIFYSAIIAWIIYYTFQAFTLGWGSHPDQFFNQTFLHLGKVPESTFSLGALNGIIASLVTVVWIVTAWVLLMGIQKGIERVNKIMVPALLVMFVLVVAYSVTLPGATQGLQQFFQPQWDRLGDPKIWLAAYGQVFFSTSVAAGMMITYAAYTPKNSDLNTNAVITGLGNSSVELAAGFGVFAALGFLAHQQGVPVDKVVSGGPGLIFAVYPSILNQIPQGLNSVVGVVFYISLLFAGFSSLISLVEVVVASIKSKFRIKRKTAVMIVVLPLFMLSLLIATDAGMYLLDILDHFVNTFAWVTAGLFEIVGVLLVLYISKRIMEVIGHGNEYSKLKIPVPLEVTLLSITGIFLIYCTVQGFITEIKTPYGGYPSCLLNFWGWGAILFVTISTIVFTLMHSTKKNK